MKRVHQSNADRIHHSIIGLFSSFNNPSPLFPLNPSQNPHVLQFGFLCGTESQKMAWRGSFSRTLMSTARASSFRSSSPTLPRLRPPSLSAPRVQSRRISFPNPRNLGELGCSQSLLPLLAGARLISHLTVSARACCELSHGTFCQTCQDR